MRSRYRNSGSGDEMEVIYRLIVRWQKFFVGLIVGWLLHMLAGYAFERWRPTEGFRPTDSWQPTDGRRPLDDNLFGFDRVYTNYTTTPGLASTVEQLQVDAFADFLPHLQIGQPSLEPTVLLAGRGNGEFVVRSPPELVIAIPSVHRSKQNYLLSTLRELLGDFLAPAERRRVAFVLLLAERKPAADPLATAFIRETLDGIRTEFGKQLADGLIEVVLPPDSWYPPDLEAVPSTFGDSPDRMYWRTKQNLDYAYLMAYVHRRYPQSTYYLQLEDDILAVQNYVSGVLRFAHDRRDWILCEYSKLGFIGKLVHRVDLPAFVHAILLLYREQPVDWILNELFRVKYCPRISQTNACNWALYIKTIRPQHFPPLFQHDGRHSSLAGKTQGLVEKSYQRDIVIPLLSADSQPSGGWRLADLRLPSGVSDAVVNDFFKNETPLSLTFEDDEDRYYLDVIHGAGNNDSNATVVGVELTFSYVSTDAENVPNRTLPFTVFAVMCGRRPDSCATIPLANNASINGNGPATVFRHKFETPPSRLRVEFGRRPAHLTLTSMRLL